MQRRTRIILSVVGAVAAVPVVVGMVQGAEQAAHTANHGPTSATTTPAVRIPLGALTQPASRPTETQPASGKPTAHPSSASPSTAAAAPEPSCALPNGQDVLVRYIVPGLQPAAQELGEVDLAQCESTLDYIAQTSPMGDGYCTQVAWASDNPGYNPDTLPAPPLKKVVEAVGGGC